MQQLSEKQPTIHIGARSSPLAKAQVKEICEALALFHPHIQFQVHEMTTAGDKDKTTSLRTLEKTDFFTREIDAWVLQSKGRVGIHSAKDLPYPLPQGLEVFCLTKGVDSSDVLVLRPHETLESLPPGAIIATSSKRREETVQSLRNDFCFCDLRGTIEERLAKLDSKEADGVVVAEAALIRLRLTHLNRIRLPGSTAEGQGKLAVVGMHNDLETKHLFTCLDER